jgi:MoxR-like ATPase
VLDLRPAATPLHELAPVLSRSQVLELQARADHVRVDRTILEYIVAFAAATRADERLRHGLSPRGSLALAQAARATALSQGRDFAVPEDVLDNIPAVCAHRIVAHAGEPPASILRDILESVPSPA